MQSTPPADTARARFGRRLRRKRLRSCRLFVGPSRLGSRTRALLDQYNGKRRSPRKRLRLVAKRRLRVASRLAREPSLPMNLPHLLLAFTLAAAPLHADDWPQWLGPQRDSVWRETGILEKFPEQGPP